MYKIIEKYQDYQALYKCNTCGSEFVKQISNIRKAKLNPCRKCRQADEVKRVVKIAKENGFNVKLKEDNQIEITQKITLTALRRRIYDNKKPRRIHD